MEFIEDLKENFDSVDPTQPTEAQPLDPTKYSAFVKNPGDITEDVLYQLADIISGRMNVRARRCRPVIELRHGGVHRGRRRSGWCSFPRRPYAEELYGVQAARPLFAPLWREPRRSCLA